MRPRVRHLISRRSLAALSCALGGLALWAPPSGAADPPVAPTVPAAADAATVPGDIDLSQQAGLQAKVTIEARRQPLSEFLASVSAKQPVALKVPPQLLQEALVTVHVENYPLSQLMLSLQSLYNFRWSRVSAQEYVLDTPVGTKLDAAVGQLGDMDWLDFRLHKPQPHPPGEEPIVNWTPDVVAMTDVRQLRSPGGVPFNELSEDVQRGIRGRLEARARLSLVERLAQARVETVQAYPLTIFPLLARDKKTVLDYQVMVQDRESTWSFPLFHISESLHPTAEAAAQTAAGGP